MTLDTETPELGTLPRPKPVRRAKPAPRQKVQVHAPPIDDALRTQWNALLEQWRKDGEFMDRLDQSNGPTNAAEEAEFQAVMEREELYVAAEERLDREQFAKRKRQAALDDGEGLTPWQRKLREKLRSPDQQRQPNGTVEKLVAQNEQLQERLERLERGSPQFIESEPTPQAQARIADDEELTEWQRSLRRETRVKDPASMVRTEPLYNAPLRYYMRPDGDIVQLQADSKNLAYYTDTIGFRVLSAEEERHYLKVERPRIVKLQQQHASLINGIRAAVARDVTLAVGLPPTWEADLDKMTIPEKQELFDEIANTPTADGKTRRMFKRLERLQSADDRRDEAAAQQKMAGVETNASLEDLQRKLKADGAQTRTIEVTRENADKFKYA